MTIRRMGSKSKLKEQVTTATPQLIKAIALMTDRNFHFESREDIAKHLSQNLEDAYKGLRKIHGMPGVGNDAVFLRNKIEPYLNNMIKKRFKNADEVIEVL